VAAAVAAAVGLPLARAYLSRRSPAGRRRAVWRRAVFRQKTPQALAVPRSWVQKKELSTPMMQRDWMGRELSGREAAMPAPEWMACSYILCCRGTLQEGEARRRL